MARVGHIQRSRAKVHVVKLCMDSQQDRVEYEKIKNDPVCQVVDKQFFSTPKGVVWVVVEYTK